MADSEAAGTSYEEEHVHEVYEQIASHFSSTRYKVCVTPLLSLQKRLTTSSHGR